MSRMSLTQADFTRGHFTILLGVMTIFLFVLVPILRVFPVIRMLLDLFFLFIVGWSCYTVSDSRRTFIRGLSLAGLALVAGGLALTLKLPSLKVVSLASSGLFCFFMAFAILGRVLAVREVTLDAIFGGVCAYFFLGLVWAFVYALIHVIDPNAFNISTPLITEGGDSPVRPNALFVYFSFVTLTTLGYGDMSPLSETARSLVVLEAVVGPFYMAILIGWLVGQARGFSSSNGDPSERSES